ncbi:MAG: hypothetical protein IJ213_03695 [Bacteroidales bacterium]|nr:hypothetical protein [Bacteroidales bacterium]
MKKHIKLLKILFICSTIFLCTACKPKIKDVERLYKSVTESDAYRFYKMQNRVHKFNQLREYIYSSYVKKCDMCNGWGILYISDEYGNAILDNYGNIQYVYCGKCHGEGINQ